MNRKIACIIPARLASTRLPRKVLADIHGKPVIRHVYDRCIMAKKIADVFVATPDLEIKQIIEHHGGNAILTGEASTVLDRCSKVVPILRNRGFNSMVVVQGDEPMIDPQMIDDICREHDGHSAICMYKEIDESELDNPNTVKAVISDHGYFVYLSRAPIPGKTPEKYGEFTPPYYKQVCVFAFGMLMIEAFGNLEMGPIERSEGIDVLRLIEHGIPVQALESKYETHAVDVEEDLEILRELMQ